MADKPFLTDIKTLRERARQHIENGAVTEGYTRGSRNRSETFKRSAGDRDRLRTEI